MQGCATVDGGLTLSSVHVAADRTRKLLFSVQVRPLCHSSPRWAALASFTRRQRALGGGGCPR